MSQLFHQLLLDQATRTPEAMAVGVKSTWCDYASVASHVKRVASGLQQLGLTRFDRVAVYLPKTLEAVYSFFGVTAAGGVMVPVNPVLKSQQVFHILNDCNVRILITNAARYKQLKPSLSVGQELLKIILVDETPETDEQTVNWNQCLGNEDQWHIPPTIDNDMAAILYTSGSTGKPKGVVLSHRNLVTGAHSVAEYLHNTSDDRLLCVLPFSFDYGLSQLSTAFSVGASCYLLEYLLPQDIIKSVAKENITGLALVPPLWIQLAKMNWGDSGKTLRYFTNSGGAMPSATLSMLKAQLPGASPYLMYGLTEAFRSSYLPPSDIDQRPTSMGKAIPGAELMVINEQGNECRPGEPGELVHRGSLVAMGYWNNPEKTAERFKPAPNQPGELSNPELAVWSGDVVTKDEEGYLYFVGRRDELIKTSGYRVSPSEIEEVVYTSGLVSEGVALGIPHSELGQAIILVVANNTNQSVNEAALIKYCKQQLPAYMVPKMVCNRIVLPRNPNGKVDRKRLHEEHSSFFVAAGAHE